MTKQSRLWDKKAHYYHNSGASSYNNVWEREINSASIVSLFPHVKKNIKVLDIGCGDGFFTNKIYSYFTNTHGCDVSKKMIDIAKVGNKNINFFVWDMEKKFPQKKNNYDLVVCKLVLMFVVDLNRAARELYKIVKRDGHIIVSVIHPFYWAYQYILYKNSLLKDKSFAKFKDGYFTKEKIPRDILDDDNLRFEFIHRTFEEYVNTFTNNGFYLDMMDEPKPSKRIIKKFPRLNGKKDIPLRLNLRFVKKHT